MMRRAGMMLIWILTPISVSAEPVEFCDSHSWLGAVVTPAPLFVCPQGDSPTLIDQGWWIGVRVIGEFSQSGIPDIPATDFWLIDCDPTNDAVLCGGALSSNADSATNAEGKTTLSLTTLSAGGCADGMAVVVQGFTFLDSLSNCTITECLPVWLRSPNINGSLGVDLVDLSIFAASFPPEAFESCCDLNVDGGVGLQDLSLFASHFGPPGHVCS